MMNRIGRLHIFTSLILAVTSAPSSSYASSTPATAQSSAAIEFPEANARVWKLPNGLTLIVREDRSAPVASVQAWCATGSVHEGKWLGAGLSHILEHMLFKGTKTRGANEIARTIEDLGGYINAYTSFDRTVYWIDVPKNGVSLALSVLCDAMMNSTLPEDEYVKEQEVIRREFAMGKDDPDRVVSRLLFATAYTEHPFQHPVIGHLEVYNKLTRDDVMEYYRERYVPNNLTFVVAGDVDADAIHKQLNEFFEEYPRAKLAPVYVPSEPRQLGRREQHEEFPTDLSRVLLGWHIPGVEHPDMPALDVLAHILGGGRSSRLYQTIREKEQLVFSISAGAYTPAGQGLFIVSATTEPDKRDAALSSILRIVGSGTAVKFEPAEIERARLQLFSGEVESFATMRGQASTLGGNWFLTRNLDFTRLYLEAVGRVTAEDLVRVTEKYLQDDNLTVVSLNPPSASDNATVSSHPTEALPETFTLSNGLRVVLREDKRLPLVTMSAVFNAGLLAEEEKNNGVSRLLSRVLLKGTKLRSAEEIANQIEGAGGSISSESGNNTLAVNIDILSPKLEIAADVLADVLLNATIPEQAIETERASQIASIREENDDMVTVARNALRAELFKGHPYALRSTGSVESVTRLTRTELVEFRDKILTASNGVLAVFGDIEKEQIRALLEKKFGALPAGGEAFPAANKPIPPLEKSTVVTNTLPKNQAVLTIGYRGTSIKDPDRVTLDLINELSSDMGSRFFQRIREKLGLAYFVSSVHQPGVQPGMFMFFLGTDPAKLEKVQAEFEDEIRKLADAGPTEEEWTRAKSKLLGQLQIARQSNSSFAYSCALDELYGLGANFYSEYEAAIRAATLDQARAATAKYFKDAPRVISIVTRAGNDASADQP